MTVTRTVSRSHTFRDYPHRRSHPSRKPQPNCEPSVIQARFPALPGERPTVLLVEDADEVRAVLAAFLEKEGFSVTAVATGEAALEKVKQATFNLVVLDVGLPGIDGFETCRLLRQRSDAHVLMLSVRTDEVDKMVGFATGADDYVDKPFSPRELVARMRAAVRRQNPTNRELLVVGALSIDVAARQAILQGEMIQLTRIEFNLLLMLVQREGAVVSRTELLTGVWGPTWVDSGSDHLVEVHVSNMRRKLVAAGGHGIVRTVRQHGYCIDGGLRRSA